MADPIQLAETGRRTYPGKIFDLRATLSPSRIRSSDLPPRTDETECFNASHTRGEPPVDNRLLITITTSLSAAIMASPGTQQFTVFAVNTEGTVWSQSVTATIQ
jgi:hypothetical protein